MLRGSISLDIPNTTVPGAEYGARSKLEPANTGTNRQAIYAALLHIFTC